MQFRRYPVLVATGSRYPAGDAIRKALMRFKSNPASGSLTSVADSRIDVPETTDCLKAVRWLRAVSHDVARNGLHPGKARRASGM